MAKENRKIYVKDRGGKGSFKKMYLRSWFCFSHLTFVDSVNMYLLSCHHMPDSVLVQLGIKQRRQQSS